MPDIELVVEVDGGFSEISLDIPMKCNGSFDYHWYQLLNWGLERREMLLQEAIEDCEQRCGFREGDRTGPEVTL